MKIKTLIVLCIINIVLHAQTFPVGQISINFKDAARSGGLATSGAVQMPGTGRDISTELFYPAVSNGTQVAMANGVFPVVVLGHGFVMTFDNYNNIYNKLASEGFIVALPRTEGSLSPNHLEFGKDIAYLSEAVKALNTISSPSAITLFNGKVSSKTALGGHSMGGGCSLIGAQNNSSITCAFNMAAALSNTAGISSIAGASLVTVPVLYLSAQRDCVTDTTVQNNHYFNTAANKKFQVILKDMTHCDFGNGTSALCVFGQNSSGCANTTANSLLFDRYMNYLAPFLKNQLKDDCLEGVRFMDSITSNSSLRSGRKITGSIACVTGVNEEKNQNAIHIFPNPVKELLEIRTSRFDLNSSKIILYDAYGSAVRFSSKMDVSGTSVVLDCSSLNPGIYFISVLFHGEHILKKIVKTN